MAFPSKKAGGGLDEQPSKLHPTSVVGVISVAPEAEELLLESAHEAWLCKTRTPSAVRLSTTRIAVQLET